MFFNYIKIKKRGQNNLALADDFRTLRWEEVFGYPEGALKQMRELLANV